NPHHPSLQSPPSAPPSTSFNPNLLPMISNPPNLTQPLKQSPLYIPHTTLFPPAQHHTSTHTFPSLYLPHTLSPLPLHPYQSFNHPIPIISQHPNPQPFHKLPTIPPLNHPLQQPHPFPSHSTHLPPESRFPKNPSFIIARPQLTKAIHLERRTFLHNYHWRKDKDGTLL
ncbi:putative inorganic carbon transporter subunit DabA, partial [Staphylococcus aureus]|uniref:putative inorganic carbon transporter subunit DabA n=1 Tax=Staphylococcus aureus TaxID=1280 RepID=UPI0011A22657